MLVKLTTVLFLIILTGTPCPGQRIKVVEVGTGNQLPQPYVYSLDQDRDGFLWIGTGAGLVRYDGLDFELYTTADSLCDDFITCSCEESQGLWFGHMNGGITYFDGSRFYPVVRAAEALGPVSDIRCIDRTVWATTQSGGIWRIGSDHKPQLYQDPEYAFQFYAIEPVSAYECFLGTMEGLFQCSMDPDTSGTFRMERVDGIPESPVRDVVLSGNNQSLYVLTQEEGLYSYDLNMPDAEPEMLYDFWEEGIDSPLRIVQDRQGDLWIPTFGNGLVKLVPDSVRNTYSEILYTKETGLPDDNIRIVFQDREENLWLGMYGKGLARLAYDAFTFYSLEDLKPFTNIYSIYNSGDSHWLGTEGGLVRMKPLQGVTRFFPAGEIGLPRDPVTSICETPNGILWVGTKNQGIYRRPKDSIYFSQFPISDGSLENAINSLEFHKDNLYVGTERGLCRLNTLNDSITWYTNSNSGLPYNKVNHLTMASDGKLWLSTPGNRLSYLENDSLVTENIPQIQGVLDIRSILPDTGSIWIATAGNGILRLREDSIENLTTSEGLLSDFCYALIKDDYGNLWVSHRGGLSSINPNNGSIISLSEESGIPKEMGFNANAASKDKNGLLWFGTTSGILSYNPEQENRLNPAPALSIRSILVNNQPVKTASEIILSPGRYNIRIQFIGVYLKNPRSVSYQYQLQGLDKGWSEFFDQDYVLFNSLHDGRYRFLVRAMSSEGVINEKPVAIDILIRRPLWKHWFFFIPAIAVFLLAIYWIIKQRERLLLKEKEVLENAVKERTEEVVLQKDQIEQQKDKIEEINKNMKDSIKYARRIQNAVFPPVRLLDELFPDNFLFFQPQQTVSGDFFWVTQYQGKRIVTVSDCTGHGVPGAFMSMLGLTLLNELVHTTGITEACEILNHLKNDIMKALRQDESEVIAGDGMDMTLCVYDPATSVLQYSGAFNPLVIFSNGEMQVINADPMPVGLGAIREVKFNQHDIKMNKGDVIYLFSDGYTDQFGGEKSKKFSRRRFLNMLQEIHTLPMEDQKQRLTDTLRDWMKEEQQIDDITVMGIRF